MGQHFSSPKKRRDKRKTQTNVVIPGQDTKRQRLLQHLSDLLNPKSSPPPVSSTTSPSPLEDTAIDDAHAVQHFDHVDEPSFDEDPDYSARHVASGRLYDSWTAVIPTIIESYLQYLTETTGKLLAGCVTPLFSCHGGCEPRRSSLLCLYFDLLLRSGLFPTAPSQPRIAISIELLGFYRALFERSCDSINALASALNTHYERRGFRLTTREGKIVQEPFRRSISHAVQWFDVLQIHVERHVENIIGHCRQIVSKNLDRAQSAEETPPSTIPPSSDRQSPPSPDLCASILVQRCPACFAGTTFGRPLSEGGDVHVATDGNFHHRHRRSAGSCPPFYEPMYFIPKAQVDEVGRRVGRARKRSPRQHRVIVPDEAIDQCEASYEAADGNKRKAAMDCFDDTGIMALICRHDIPLFFANIDTPGEQQKYSIALLEHLFSLLPPAATVVVLYDISCVLDRSLSKYDILNDGIVSRLRFATTAMHAYGHEWACQLTYNPRIINGLGLSDGEGTERLWSRFIKLIGIERASSRERRIWLIDRHATAIGLEMRSDLGDWIRRRLKKGIAEQGSEAQNVISDCGIGIPELRKQWSDQRSAQLSIRAHAPARLKKELDTVLVLQADVEASDRALQAARTIIVQGATQDTLDALESLERSHDRLLNKIDALYTSLNIPDKFPELHGVNLEFVRTLLMARDLKISIRKRAIGSFFEWDKLDRAVGGNQKALGTKLHQQTRKAIAKRQPALMSAIRKFNKYCERLAELYDASSGIPLPSPLPTKLAELRNDQSLLEDVWVTPSVGEIPRWLEDVDVREGIRAVLKSDRCLEEQWRLGMEADHMCRWFGRELCAIELAIRLPENSKYYLVLQQHRESLAKLQERWPNPLASAVRYASHARTAVTVATSLAHAAATSLVLQWLPPILCDVPADALSEDDAGLALDPDPIEDILDPAQIALADVLEDTESPPITNEEDSGDAENQKDSHNVDTPTVDTMDVYSNVLIACGVYVRRVRETQDGFPRQTFEANDYERLASPTARLNDTCINGCSALLYSEFQSSAAAQCAIFSMHDLPRIRYHAEDNVLWRNISWTRYWEKTTWILPIHRPSPIGHWVLCVIKFPSKQLLLFDSLAEQKPWKQDIKVTEYSCTLRLLTVRRISPDSFLAFPRRDLGSWSAHPIICEPLQSNGYDCGLWVLAQVAAVLRGYDITNLREGNMIAFRRYLQSLILSIPLSDM
ncbi:hypothetical protein M404DRAFT_130054 [Pisolithus tinctorius Marx 270]|uniref:Ubiquitin-like protease family profile domain-containing protein n=1 Tax=Pisolithus tinctorius Marx 270 TaxID=870435 RepID=A0A0C3PN47_PISTI|nr:hypothetical protein M404DRAFT_130054 [Pisolithus tinctorius Marx 270]